MIESGDIQVIIEDGNNANLTQQIAYIKAGKTEIEEAVQEGIGDFDTNATAKTNAFNDNASAKTLSFNQNADAKTAVYDNNASEKLSAYNENTTNKLAAYNANDTAKTEAYNLNATNKTTAFNTNASEKTSTFNDNAVAKTSGFNSNATSKTNDFNSNASDKTTAFNDNYTAKKALIDAEVQTAKDWATKTDGKVDGVDYSAKYYAQSILPIKDDITAVAEIATDVSDVAEIKDEVTAVAQDKENVDAVAENITNVNTVAGDHANIQTVVNNMTAINNAPTYANNSKIWAEGLDGEVTPLGGTHSAKGWAEIAEQAASGVQNPANRDLSNLTNTGQMIIDSQNGTISNCILEIPQNIKASIENNIVTVKSGTTVVLTGSTYKTLTLSQDVSVDLSSRYETKLYILLTEKGAVVPWFDFYNTGSVTTLPSDNSQYERVFNVTDKQYYLWYSTTQRFNIWGENAASYPLFVVEKVNGVWSFAKDSRGNDMIFNGMGFISNVLFVYPNIKALVSDRYDENGSLKSISITNDRMIVVNWGDGSQTNDLYLFADSEFNINRCFSQNYFEQEETPTPSGTLRFWRSNEQNITQKSLNGVWGGNWVMIAKYRRENNGTVSITPRQPVRLATTEMLDKVQEQVDTLDDNTVKLTGNQSISDTKTFANGVFDGLSYHYSTKFKYMTIKDMVNAREDSYTSQWLNGIQFTDKNNAEQGFIRIGYEDGYKVLSSSVRGRNGGYAVLELRAYDDETKQARLFDPTEDTNNSVQIDTVGARNRKLASLFTSMTGYDATKTQTLKNVNGTLTWVDD